MVREAAGVTGRSDRARRAALVLILLVAAAIRLRAVGLGNASLTFQIDEEHNVLIPLTLSWRDLNPHAFYLPSLLWYMLFAVDHLVFAIGKAYGLLREWGDLQPLFEGSHPLPFFFVARTLSAVLGTATVGIVYLLGRRLYTPAHGLLAAGFLASAFLHVRDSALATTDAPAAFFVALSLLGAAGVLQEGRGRDYLLGAAAGGLAAATKYNAVLVLVALVAAHGLRTVWAGEPVRRIVGAPQLVGAGLVAVLVFVALDPYLFLDLPKAREDLRWAYEVFEQEGRFLDVGSGWWYHLTASLRYGMGVGLLGLALAGIVRVLWRRDAGGWALLSFAVCFFVVMARAKLVYVRYMTPLMPVLCLFAATTVLSLSGWFRWPRVRGSVVATLGILAVAEPLHASLAYGRLVHHADTRVQAYEFIQAALPPGSRVATYGPSETWRSTIPRFEPVMYSNESRQSWEEALAVLKARGIRYFLTHHSDLDVFSPTLPEIERAIRGSGTLIREFRPDKAHAPAHPVYDRDDPYYFPIGRFGGVSQPGPLVRLYRLD